MQVTASIFKAYDIRGTYLRNMDENLAEALGRAFGSLAMKEGRHTVAVGRDGRLSGPALSAALMRGLVAVGIEVIDVGLTTTPQLYLVSAGCGRGGCRGCDVHVVSRLVTGYLFL